MTLREMRLNRNLKIGYVSKLLGIHRATLPQIENGRSSLKAEHIPTLANLYGVTEKEVLSSYLKMTIKSSKEVR